MLKIKKALKPSTSKISQDEILLIIETPTKAPNELPASYAAAPSIIYLQLNYSNK
jgi:hypothetical protein